METCWRAQHLQEIMTSEQKLLVWLLSSGSPLAYQRAASMTAISDPKKQSKA